MTTRLNYGRLQFNQRPAQLIQGLLPLFPRRDTFTILVGVCCRPHLTYARKTPTTSRYGNAALGGELDKSYQPDRERRFMRAFGPDNLGLVVVIRWGNTVGIGSARHSENFFWSNSPSGCNIGVKESSGCCLRSSCKNNNNNNNGKPQSSHGCSSICKVGIEPYSSKTAVQSFWRILHSGCCLPGPKNEVRPASSNKSLTRRC